MKTCEKCGGEIAEERGEKFTTKECCCAPCRMHKLPKFYHLDGVNSRLSDAAVAVAHGTLEDGEIVISLKTLHDNGNEVAIMFSVDGAQTISMLIAWAVTEAMKSKSEIENPKTP